MDDTKVFYSHRQANRNAPDLAQKGFALVSLLALIPLTAALVISLSAGLFMMKRKSLAQAHCVQQGALLQKELNGTLDKLLKLNRAATVLRRQRDLADKALKAAILLANPYAIAAARAAWTAVFLEQTALAAKQQALLRQADQQRNTGHRQLRDKLRELHVRNVTSRKYYWRSLAVEASPITSLTPDYKPLPGFKQWQQHRFRFEVPLDPYAKIIQATECSVSLTGKEKEWKVQILAANARSNWSLF